MSWLKSYLTNHVQSIKLGETLSLPKALKFGVPQGSVLGPLLFSMYTAPLSRLISGYKLIHHHLYADDTQIYIALDIDKSPQNLSILKQCLEAVQSWMYDNLLKLNPDKTEFILIGTSQQRVKFTNYFPFSAMGNNIQPSKCVRNLGFLFDSDFSFADQVAKVRQSCFYYIKDVCRVRRYIDKSTATSLANALVSSRLDYCNSLYNGIAEKYLSKLQIIQNTLCRIVTKTSRFNHITPVRKSLHWLPIKQRIEFKLGLLTFKALQLGCPSYLRDKLRYPPFRTNSRYFTQGTNLLLVPAIKSCHSAPSYLLRKFEFAAPTLWNSFPENIRMAPMSILLEHISKLICSIKPTLKIRLIMLIQSNLSLSRGPLMTTASSWIYVLCLMLWTQAP